MAILLEPAPWAQITCSAHHEEIASESGRGLRGDFRGNRCNSAGQGNFWKETSGHPRETSGETSGHPLIMIPIQYDSILRLQSGAMESDLSESGD
jgi:hypothetical protein